MKEDWKYLIILDACRYDQFERYNKIPGKLERKISRGSNTKEFLQENFLGKKLNDIVYISANPHTTSDLKNPFYKLISVWKHAWNEQWDTVTPFAVFEETKKSIRRYPDKRFIIHFIQPHYPFIDEGIRNIIGEHDGFHRDGSNPTDKQVFKMLEKKLIDKSTLKVAYDVNLSIVLEYVEELVREFDGKTVITSDHGNLFGQWLFPFPFRAYGHPYGVRHKDLTQIPWFIVDEEFLKK